ncbi:unnamed protein product, partial [Laminaria digitata]
ATFRAVRSLRGSSHRAPLHSTRTLPRVGSGAKALATLPLSALLPHQAKTSRTAAIASAWLLLVRGPDKQVFRCREVSTAQNISCALFTTLTSLGISPHHAEERMKFCSQTCCTRQPSFNHVSIKAPAYCKKQAGDGMVNVRNRRCLHNACTTRPTFNLVGSKTPRYCKKHAQNSMVDVVNKRCLHDSCTRRPSFNLVGIKTPAYCKQHAQDGMVDVLSKRCLHDSCTRRPSFNTVGSITPIYCKQHSEDG